MHSGPISLGIVTISDRASTGVYEDKSGPAIRDVFTRWLDVLLPPGPWAA